MVVFSELVSNLTESTIDWSRVTYLSSSQCVDTKTSCKNWYGWSDGSIDLAYVIVTPVATYYRKSWTQDQNPSLREKKKLERESKSFVIQSILCSLCKAYNPIFIYVALTALTILAVDG